MSKKKKKKKRAGKTRNRSRTPAGTVEWVGGRVTTPCYITEDEPYRPEIVLWLELPGELVVGYTLIDPNEPPVSFGRTLLDAMASPMVGPPRRPGRIRVRDAELAAEIQETVPDIDIVVGPAPELDRALREMSEFMSAGNNKDLSYLEGGRISAEVVDSLFRASRLLYDISPWKAVADTQVLRLDIPSLGVEEVCLSVIGALGESLGFIIFPSYASFERLYQVADAEGPSETPVNLMSDTLSLSFERGADLPPSMRREAADHGWPVDDPAAYPWVRGIDRDGLLRPLTERDIRIVSACATSLASFFLKHHVVFGQNISKPVCESYFDERDTEVRFTYPYGASPLFEINNPPPSSSPEKKKGKVGRNAPCPCGSGKKYKKCCLEKDEAANQDLRTPSELHEMDNRLMEEMVGFGLRRFGETWFDKAAEDFVDFDKETQLFFPWSAYHFAVEGKPMARWFVEEQGDRLSGTELEWLRAQQASWLSLWEVREATPGRSLALQDLLSGEKRTVHEVSGSKALVRRDVLLCRVVDYHDHSLIAGTHSRPLPPVQAAEVERRVRGRLRRRRHVPVERLQNEKIGRYMISRWEEAVEDLEIERSIPPRLQNTDGDELLFSTDHFRFDPAVRGEIERRLTSLEGVEPPVPEDPEKAYVFTVPGNPLHESWDNTVVGRACLMKDRLRVETNSPKRADALRERIEAAYGDLVTHLVREYSDPFAEGKWGAQPPDPGKTPRESLPPEEAAAVIREFKAKQYALWPDRPLPALDGKTPREAVQTKDGRRRVDMLLKDCENAEARMPEDQQFDFSMIRRELGLDTRKGS